jgi:hypothetical protein
MRGSAVIERLEVLKQERSASTNSCRVVIKAQVKPVFPGAKEGIQIKAAITRTELREGDEVVIHYQVDRNSHVYLFVIAADSSVTQLLPNREKQENSAVSKQQYQFPPTAVSG